MRKKTKIGLIAALLAVLAGTALFCACGSEPAYYGVYSSGTSTRCASFAVNKDGFYLGDEGNHYQYQYDYTYSDGSLNVDTLGTFYCFENDQVLCMPRFAFTTHNVRDGFFNQTFWLQTGGEINGKMEFNSDGTYSLMQLVAPVWGEYGTYTLNSGVLIFHVDTITGSALADTVYEEGSQHYGYVSESGTFYATAFVKNASQFAGGNTGGNTNTPETPEPTPATYTLSYTATEGGRIVGSPTQTVSAGANGDSVMAIADEGYEFIGWSDGVQSAERLDENVTANITVTAQFAKIPEHTLNYSAQTGGTIRGNALQTVLRGEAGTTVTAVAEEGYEFIGWSDGVQSAERLDENVMEDIAVTAQFEKIPEYTLSYSAQTGGYIRGNTSQTVLRGEDGTAVTAVAEEGYEFVGWSDGEQSATRTEENVQTDVEVSAQFSELDLPAFAGGNGTQESPYQINTMRHLRHMELYPAAHYILTGNITLTSAEQGQSNFAPLFDDETMFTGTFDGNGYTISNLAIYNTDTFYTGLFACIGADGKVFDLTLENIDLQGTNYIGGVAGYALGAVTNCTVTGEIAYLSQNNYGVFLGGIAGRAENDLNGCTAEVAITAYEVGGTAYAGGIAGYCAYNMQSVESAVTLASQSAVTITQADNNSSRIYAGGIFGYVAERMNLQDCFAEGNIVITEEYSNSYAGGLVGHFNGGSNTLTNCYATGDVSGSSYAGGLVGLNDGSNTLTNCYATGDVSGGNYAGGLVGLFNGGSNTLTNCYATGDVSGSSYAGGLVGQFDDQETLVNCYALGSVTLNTKENYLSFAGGLVGCFRSGKLTNCYATGNVFVNNMQYCNYIYVGSLVANFESYDNTLTNCYAIGNITVNAQNNDTVYVGGLVGYFGMEQNIIQNSYSTSEIVYTGTATTTYLGGLIGYAGEVTLTNVHWLYFADSGTEYAVGYSATLGIPTNIGATKHSGIAEFYDLADTLNEGQETPAWEHTGANTLPTLIKKENQTEEIAL